MALLSSNHRRLIASTALIVDSLLSCLQCSKKTNNPSMFSLLVFFSPDQFEKDNRWPIHQRHVLYSLDTGITRLACIATILRTFNRTVLTRTGCFVTLHVPISYTKRRMLDTCPRSSSFCFLNHGELLNRSPWAFFFFFLSGIVHVQLTNTSSVAI